MRLLAIFLAFVALGGVAVAQQQPTPPQQQQNPDATNIPTTGTSNFTRHILAYAGCGLPDGALTRVGAAMLTRCNQNCHA